MTSKARLAWTGLLLLGAVATTSGCGDGTTTYAYAGLSITSVAPTTLSGTSTPVTITGGDFGQVVGTNVIVRWIAQTGAPFNGGTASSAEVAGTITSPTTIDSMSPAASLCGAGSFVVEIVVVLPSGAVAGGAGGLTITFAPPTISGFAGASSFPGAISTLFTLNGANLPTGAAANITWTAASPIFAGGTSTTTVTTGNVSSATTIDGMSPLAQVCGVPSEAANITDVTFTDGSCTPAGTLVAAAFDAPTLAQLNGSGAPASVPSTVLLGSATAEAFTFTGTGFGPNGSFATVDLGPPLNVSTSGLIANATTITGTLPTFTAPRLAADTTVDVTITLPGGSCATSVGLARFVAPPTIASVVNNRAPFDQTNPSAALPGTWLHCIATSTTVTGTGFDAALTELLYDTGIGDTAPIGGGVLTPDPGPAATPRTVTPPTTLTGWSPVDVSITNPTSATLRVVNPDLQFHEIGGLVFTPTGVLPNVNAGPLAGNNAEMQIAVNPHNGLNAAICAHDGGSGFTRMYHSYTLDGGITWTQGVVGPPLSLGDDGWGAGAFRFDPMCAFDRFGNYYCVYGVTDPGTGNDYIVAHRSTDGGATFSSLHTFGLPVSVGLDRWTVATGPDGVNADVANSELLLVSLIDFATGDIWLTGFRIQTGPGPNGEGGAVSSLGAITVNDVPAAGGRFFQNGTPTLDAAGRIYVSFIEGDGVAFPPSPPTDIWVSPVNVPGGVDSTDVLAATTLHSGFRVAIPPETARGKAVIPVPAALRAGPNAGRVVLVWSDMTNAGAAGQQTDVVTQVSDDGGLTWSLPALVHPANANYQFFPWIAVDPVNGYPYVGYYDTSADTTNNRRTQWKVVGSTNGSTWTTTALLVSQAQSDAGAAGGLNDMLEYNGISVVNDCIFTCWADNSNFTLDNPSGTLVADGFDVLTSVLTLDTD